MWGSSEVINYPNGAPELKQLKAGDTMSSQDFIVLHYADEAMRFKTISVFKNSLVNGGEIVIDWNAVEYGIFREKIVSLSVMILRTQMCITIVPMNCWNTVSTPTASGM